MDLLGRRHQFSWLILVFVLATHLDITFSRHHIRHHRNLKDRFKRQQGAHLYLAGSYVTSGGEGTDIGPWSGWSEPSACSRSCGGGVSTQYRTCQEGNRCQGPTKRHYSCNTQDCPDETDFRAEQCTEFNQQSFDGAYYNWVPYTKAPNPCELNCMPRGERFYYRHKLQVADGTRCSADKLDVCVEGQCQPVGCDMMLGSNAREDKCRQCGGDGTTCNTVSKVLDNLHDLQQGYNDIILIPAGATNIVIKEVAPSNNYLAVRNITGDYYLNGNWRIDFPRTLRFAGALFHYERYPQGFAAPDTIRALGPTDETIFIVLLVQDTNPGISYEYSLPKSVQTSPNTEGYTWTFDQFSPCSVSCGRGVQSRNVTCHARNNLELVERSLCDVNTEPASKQSCAEIPCESKWTESAWGECSAMCGEEGVQTRSVNCERIDAEGYPSAADEEECNRNVGPKPSTKQACNRDVVCPKWHTGPWKPCNRLCGEGKQVRKVLCYRTNNGKIEVLPDSACAPQTRKPEENKSCNNRPCDGIDWVTSEWGGCENKCGLSNETRRVQCMTQKGIVFPDSFCEGDTPDLVRECKSTDQCEHQWYATQWSECSAKCGNGVQTRNVFCGNVKDETITKTDDDKCKQSTKYEAIRNCTSENDTCAGEWFMGPWSKCSKKCGGGEWSRKVICMKDDLPSSKPEDCDPDLVPSSSETCNNEACGEDEILPVDVTKPVDESEPKESSTEKPKGELEEDEDDEEGECDEDDTEWLSGEEDDDDGLELLDLIDESTIPPSTDSSMFTDDEVMLSDSTASDLRSTDVSSSTVDEEGSGTEDTTEIFTSPMETDFGGSGDGESTVEMTEKSSSTSDSDKEQSTEGKQSTGASGASEVTESSAITEPEISSKKSSEVSGAASSASSDGTTEAATTDQSTATATGASSTEEPSSSVPSSTATSSDESSSEGSSSTSSSESTSDSSSTTDSSSSSSSSPSTTETPTSYETTLVDMDTSSTTTVQPEGSSTESSASTTDSVSTTTDDVTTTTSSVDSTSEQDITHATFIPPDVNIESDIGSNDSEEETASSGPESSPQTTESGDTDETSEGASSTTESVSETSTGSTVDVSTEQESSAQSTESTVAVSTESTVEVSTGSTADVSTDSTVEVSTDSTIEVTTVTSASVSDESTETDIDIWTTTQISDTSETDEDWSTGTTPNVIFTTPRARKCARRKKKKDTCKTSEFGCCFDGTTPAEGPFDKGCLSPKTCNETKYKCCEDGVSPAQGPKFKGCPDTLCAETLFGCCQDNKTAAEGNDFEGCPPPPPACLKSKYGCCKDNVTEAKGPKGKGCQEKETTKKPPVTVDCSKSEHGCCPDGTTVAKGEDFQGCDIFKDNCTESYFGCCPDGVSSAQGPNNKGCTMDCDHDPYGCCPDGITPAHGPSHEGCCLSTPYGCCPDNIRAARGPNLEDCGCLYGRYGCCPDNSTSARGPNNEGCGCEHTDHKCCPDGYTPAAGPDHQGCQCHTFQFGCCPDGITRAKGPHQQGCGCRNTEFGCCSDDQTPASGANFAGCDCASSKHGCCPDGVTEAQSDNYDGCEEVPENLQVVCSLPKERGSCRNYTVKWFFDMEYGGCSRFWYGGCEGNGNRFMSTEECKDVCMEPSEPRDVCQLPKVSGPCEGYYPKWYFDRERNQCIPFVYGGCLGNANRFETSEECAKQCVVDRSIDACEQQQEEGPCRGNYHRWSFNKETNECEQFRYGGCKSNNNNFPTEYACKQQCSQPGRKKDHCSLPRAQGNCTEKDPRWYYDSSEKRCMPFYYSGCEGNNNNFISEDACQTDCPADIERDTCTLPALVGDCHNYVERWYFDTAERRCRQFYYGGCGGNENNFNSEDDCLNRCERKATPAPVVPEEPFRTEFCFLREDAGPCRDQGQEARWFYDSSDGVCKQFMYGGCQGNGNNFKTREECHRGCGAVQDLCALPVVVGPCNGEHEQWYYDRRTDSCQPFKYGGCWGNDNRFENQQTCEQRCKSGGVDAPPPVAPAVTQAPEPEVRPHTLSPEEEICFTQVDAGNCTDEVPAYFYDPSQHRCSAFMYTGCGGNANRYTSEEQCERQCGRFRGLDVCVYPKDAGPCDSVVAKYYFDPETRRCTEFAFGGCDGNGNRFSSVEECQSVCIGHVEKKPPENETMITSDTICRLPLQMGNCEGGYQNRRYYFSEEEGDCRSFIYNGCGGNFNNFKTYNECMDKCRDLLAPPPDKPDIDVRVDVDEPSAPDVCAQHTEACRTIRCPYGMEAFVDENNCNQCRCHNPCDGYPCEQAHRCAVEINMNITDPHASQFIAVCRPEVKEGECPEHSQHNDRCENPCSSDAECMFDLKCCYTQDCGYQCTVPHSQTPPGELVTESLPSYTEAPIQAGYYPPIVDENETPPHVTAEEGSFATLRCIVRGNPNPNISWKRGDLMIDGNTAKYRILLDGSLQVISLFRTDAGIYICIADNGVGRPIHKEIELNVTEPQPSPAFVLGEEDSHVTVGLGSPHSLQCYAVGWPRPTVTWWRGESMVPFNSADYKHSRDASLLIQSVKLSNLGVYTCQAYNGLGKAASWSVTVHAIGPVHTNNPDDQQYIKYVVDPPERPQRPQYPYRPEPVATQPPYIPPPLPETVPETPTEPRGYTVPVRTDIKLPFTKFAVGADVSIPCETEGYPIPQVQWYKNNDPIYPGGNIEVTEANRLIIHRANHSDSGQYRCEASNQYSRSDTVVAITVEGMYIDPACTDNPFFANCALIVKAKYCTHKYYAKFCCRSCTQARQLPSYGPHLDGDKHSAISSNQVRRK